MDATMGSNPRLNVLLWVNVAFLLIAFGAFVWISILIPMPASADSTDVDTLRTSLRVSKSTAGIAFYMVGTFLVLFGMNVFLANRLRKLANRKKEQDEEV